MKTYIIHGFLLESDREPNLIARMDATSGKKAVEQARVAYPDHLIRIAGQSYRSCHNCGYEGNTIEWRPWNSCPECGPGEPTDEERRRFYPECR